MGSVDLLQRSQYCCVVRNPAEDDAAMQGRFTIPRDALELNNTLSARVPAAQSATERRNA